MKFIAITKRLLIANRNLKTNMLKDLLPTHGLLLPLNLTRKFIATLLIIFIIEVLVDEVTFFGDIGFV